ncbi:MAG: hypothetical protein K0R57_3231 [Paenibacillaceae bacterium]|jgi:hypothetical protein|nr:hypothetical protein [Paenibacillaceae bacterium]
MGRKNAIACILGLAVLFAAYPEMALAADSNLGGGMETSSFMTYNSNPPGADFGSDAELGASASTPGFIINRDGNPGTVQALSAGNRSNMTRWKREWDWLGILGLLGLTGLRKTNRVH